MKALYWEFETDEPASRVTQVFQTAVKQRPLKLKVVPAKFFKPNFNDPIADSLGVRPEAQSGVMLSIKLGPDPPLATVVVTCVSAPEAKRLSVIVRCTGNMRGRGLYGNPLAKHVLQAFQAMDPSIRVEESKGRA